MEFQKLLEIIKKYKGGGEDYTRFWKEVGNGNSGEIFKESEVYEIYSPELKKELRNLALFGHIEDGGFSTFSTSNQIEGKWYEYQKGDGTNPDQFTIREISPQKRKEQEQRDREQAERDRQLREREEKGFNSKKQCAFCEKEIDLTKGGVLITERPRGSSASGLNFCSGECIHKYYDIKENQKNPNSPYGKKCAGCENIIEGEYFGVGEKGSFYCSVECANKNHKPKSEIEKAQEKLQNLQSKLKKSSTLDEKNKLEQEIENTQNRLKDLENEPKKSQTNESSKNNKLPNSLIFGGIIGISVITGVVSLLIIRNKRKKK